MFQMKLKAKYRSDFKPKRVQNKGGGDSSPARKRHRYPAPVSRQRTMVLGPDMKIHWEG
jgi:hypothetical protein